MKFFKSIALIIIIILVVAGLVALVILQSRKNSSENTLQREKEAIGKTYQKNIKIDSGPTSDVQNPLTPKISSYLSATPSPRISVITNIESREVIDKEIVPTIHKYGSQAATIQPTINQKTKGGVSTLPRAGIAPAIPVLAIIIAFGLVITSFIL